MTEQSGPKFFDLMGPVLNALRELGGSARPSEVESLVAEKLHIPSAVQDQQLPSGGLRFRNRVHWARFYLAKSGLLDASKRGVWSLTEKGQHAVLDEKRALELVKEVQQNFSHRPPTGSTQPKRRVEAVEEEVFSDYSAELLSLLKSLPSDGFERLCQRLLREAGFQQVTVTGKSGDGGLDGNGILQVNPLVSFRVYFQCKRWAGSVGPSVVRDFRGATMGRADKGIILTTGTFTSEARREAVRDGVPPIELVDGEALVEMFETLELGLRPKTVFEVDEQFFEEFGYKESKR